MAERRELIKGNIDSLLLSLIGREPMYGYQILKDLEQKSEGYFRFKEGTLYPALHRLEKVGLIVSKWEGLPSGRLRRYSSITEKGARLLAMKRSQWADFATAMNRIIQPAPA